MVWNRLRPTHCSEKNCVVSANPFFPIVRQHFVVLQIIVAGRKIELVQLEREAELLRRCFKNPYAFRDNFPADSIAGDNSDFVIPIRVFLTVIGHLQNAFPVSKFYSAFLRATTTRMTMIVAADTTSVPPRRESPRVKFPVAPLVAPIM